MPVHNVGYRPWAGKKTPQWKRWWIISQTGISLAFKSAWVKRIMFFAWIPLLYWGVFFFGIGQYIDLSPAEKPFTSKNDPARLVGAAPVPQSFKNRANRALRRESLGTFIDNFPLPLPGRREVIKALSSDDDDVLRNRVWNSLFLGFLRYPQATVILLLLGFIAPGLISRDFRSRAFLLYFSKPIGRIEYMLGKLFVPAVFIVFVTTLPALVLYVFAIGMSPNLTVVFATRDVPLRIVAASACLIIPTSLLALMLSSLTHESRFASFAWFAIWALGHGAWASIVVAQWIRMAARGEDGSVFSSDLVNDWSVLSLYNNLGEVQSWIFGFRELSEIWPEATVLIVLSLVSIVVLYRQISAPVNI